MPTPLDAAQLCVEAFQQLRTDAHRRFEFGDERLIERADAAWPSSNWCQVSSASGARAVRRCDSGDDDVGESVAGRSARPCCPRSSARTLTMLVPVITPNLLTGTDSHLPPRLASNGWSPHGLLSTRSLALAVESHRPLFPCLRTNWPANASVREVSGDMHHGGNLRCERQLRARSIVSLVASC